MVVVVVVGIEPLQRREVVHRRDARVLGHGRVGGQHQLAELRSVRSGDVDGSVVVDVRRLDRHDALVAESVVELVRPDVVDPEVADHDVEARVTVVVAQVHHAVSFRQVDDLGGRRPVLAFYQPVELDAVPDDCFERPAQLATDAVVVVHRHAVVVEGVAGHAVGQFEIDERRPVRGVHDVPAVEGGDDIVADVLAAGAPEVERVERWGCHRILQVVVFTGKNRTNIINKQNSDARIASKKRGHRYELLKCFYTYGV